MEKHLAYFNILDALKEKGCPICFLCKKMVNKYLSNFLYENVNDSGVRKKLRNSLGFCNVHAWEVVDMQDCLGTAIVYKDINDLLISEISKWGRGKKILFRKALSKKILDEYITRSKNKCPACREYEDCEKIYLVTLLEHFYDIELNSSFRHSYGLCFIHFLKTIKVCKDKKIVKELIDIEMEKLKSLSEELAEFIRKHNYRFSHEKHNKEADSWKRVVEKIIGKEGIV